MTCWRHRKLPKQRSTHIKTISFTRKSINYACYWSKYNNNNNGLSKQMSNDMLQSDLLLCDAVYILFFSRFIFLRINSLKILQCKCLWIRGYVSWITFVFVWQCLLGEITQLPHFHIFTVLYLLRIVLTTCFYCMRGLNWYPCGF